MSTTTDVIWEKMYQDGGWEFLKEIQETGHYAVIAGYLRRLVQGAAIVDLGCGEALLYRYLHPRSVASYTGIDIAPTAIRKAEADPSRMELIAGSLDGAPIAGRCWDAIVCNEILYCLPKPIQTLQRYLGRLSSPGYVVVSMYDHNLHPDAARQRVRGIWRDLEAAGLTALDETGIVSRPRNLRWTVKAFRYQNLSGHEATA
ncbi:MAG: class I SAM-dependent methyltransferase [Bryobacterales bacterium]|nr:class I SAM-dependent methyltransferase [Bryobacterales bacterium]